MILVITGIIALAGIVVNNNIVLIDTYQRLKSNGFSSEDAALRTAAQRLRPVILTTLQVIFRQRGQAHQIFGRQSPMSFR